MIQIKNNFSKICVLLFVAVTIASFNNKNFVFEGGTINNPNMVIAPNTTPPEITATNATGCGGTVTYQWQQSSDAINFIDVPNGAGASYQSGLLIKTTHFRRKATCQGGGTAYTSNVATIIVQ